MKKLWNISIEPNVMPGIPIEPILGEFAWHSITTDPTILDISKAHFESILDEVKQAGLLRDGLKILEVGAYAHITGYMLAQKIKADVTLADISQSTLTEGYNISMAEGYQNVNIQRIACDFHSLPFESNKFDVVYIASALHHTWRYQTVLSELARVTAKEGLLILENEPLRRELCLYEFRTNRPDNFDEKEIKLEQSCLLRTIAEPYYGSRAELLFGMTENQEMDLGGIINSVSNELVIKKINVNPQICMGELEKKIDEELCKSHIHRPNEIIFDIFREYIDKAQANSAVKRYLNKLKLTQSYGYLKLKSLIDRATKRLDLVNYKISPICNISSTILDTASIDIIQLNRAILFGGSFRLVATKEVLSEQVDFPIIKNSNNIVATGFESCLDLLMNSVNELFPNIQNGDLSEIARAFGEDWDINKDDSIVTATPKKLDPEILIDHDSTGSLLISVRVYALMQDIPWSLGLFVDDELRAHIEFSKSDSALLIVSISNAISPNTLRFSATGNAVDYFNISHLSIVYI